ncbi:hypothetical protein RRG08_003647 [Elysia crispata]|uniref:Uncharacterized protein n=1 Tax=Elysia crispata TaxID=231223 RepID=A0AAE1AUY4_9GAST|nr:hypothetical protein RRG08_003647 [Elysia crispata]
MFGIVFVTMTLPASKCPGSEMAFYSPVGAEPLTLNPHGPRNAGNSGTESTCVDGRTETGSTFEVVETPASPTLQE